MHYYFLRFVLRLLGSKGRREDLEMYGEWEVKVGVTVAVCIIVSFLVVLPKVCSKAEGENRREARLGNIQGMG